MTAQDLLSPESITRMFDTGAGYRFARWGRPIAPVVFGTDDASLTHIKTAITQTVHITGQTTEETDAELGANMMWFFFADWAEVSDLPDLDKLVPDLPVKVDRLIAQDASRYRYFAFDAGGGIKFCAIFLRMQGDLADMPIQALITGEVVKSLLLWGPAAFDGASPVGIVRDSGYCVVKPDYAALIRAAYDPVMPVSADDPSHALRLSARAGLLARDLAL